MPALCGCPSALHTLLSRSRPTLARRAIEPKEHLMGRSQKLAIAAVTAVVAVGAAAFAAFGATDNSASSASTPSGAPQMQPGAPPGNGAAPHGPGRPAATPAAEAPLFPAQGRTAPP